MAKSGGKWLSLICLGIVLFLSLDNLSPAKSEIVTDRVSYDVYERSLHTIHVVTIPHDSNYIVTPGIGSELTPIGNFVQSQQAVAAINGGYFDPKNQKTTSYIIQQGKIVGDPRTNERLIDNPDLQPYLGKILNRVEFRRYLCGEQTRYDIVSHSVRVPTDCQLQDALGGGPGLLPQDSSVAEGFTAYQGSEIIRDAIASTSLNARSAVGITDRNDIVLVMVAQKTNISEKTGISLPDMTEFLLTLGATKAMNLDGGSSASLYYRGKTFYGKVDGEGNRIQRPIKSALLVTNR